VDASSDNRDLPRSQEVSTVRTVKLARVAQHVLFRAAVAILCLAVHLIAITHFAAIHFGLPFNSLPDDPPVNTVVDTSIGPEHWNRLVVSRWDTGNYELMALDGLYEHCPKADLRGADLNTLTNCDLAFYPGYPLLGWLASWGARLPIDYALLSVSLVASFFLLFLWTGPVIVNALGLWGTYCSLLLFSVYTTSFTLAATLSEPCTLLFVFAAFVCLEKRRFLLGALFAGAASGMRITGFCATAAYAFAILLWAWDEDELSVKDWIKVAVIIPLSAWGVLTMMIFDWWRFNDSLIYAHAHEQAFGHDPQAWHILWPDPSWVVKSMASPVHDVVLVAVMTLWFALGHREGLQGFSRLGKAYWYVQFIVALCLPLYGSAQLGYGGMTRYTLMLFGAFFAMSAILKRRPLALSFWCGMSLWHYWNADLCFFEQHSQPGGMDQCLVDVRQAGSAPNVPMISPFQRLPFQRWQPPTGGSR
jgi:hypothetical protein